MSHENASLPFLVNRFPSFISCVLLERVGSDKLEETCCLGYVALGTPDGCSQTRGGLQVALAAVPALELFARGHGATAS